MFKDLSERDPAVTQIMEAELERQRKTIDLIASENFTSRSILQAQCSVLSNKYAEGMPGHRYYAGCENADKVENLARDRVKQLFGAEHANVQPHSGSQANAAVYLASLQVGDTVLGLSLAHGGHLTHGSKANFSGKLYQFISYGVNRDTEQLDYEEIYNMALKHKPKMIVTGASAYPRTIHFDKFKEIADAVGAMLLVDMAHIAGLIAAGEHPSPVPYADFVTATTHKTLRGPRSGFVLCRDEYANAIDKAVFPGLQGGPMMHDIAAKAVCFREAQSDEFRAYQRQIKKNAKKLAEVLIDRGFRIVSGGTDNHLMLVDLQSLNITGQEAEDALSNVGLIANKNAIPFDPKPPAITSGIRLGTPAVTTRGMKESQIEEIGNIIADTITGSGFFSSSEKARNAVAALCDSHPLYQGLSYSNM